MDIATTGRGVVVTDAKSLQLLYIIPNAIVKFYQPPARNKPQVITTCGFAGISVDVRWFGYIAMRCLDRLCTAYEIMFFV